MNWLTRLVLRLLGWRSQLCRDARGDKYESWVRFDGPQPSYFHVYHERKCGKVVRP